MVRLARHIHNALHLNADFTFEVLDLGLFTENAFEPLGRVFAPLLGLELVDPVHNLRDGACELFGRLDVLDGLDELRLVLGRQVRCIERCNHNLLCCLHVALGYRHTFTEPLLQGACLRLTLARLFLEQLRAFQRDVLFRREARLVTRLRLTFRCK